MGFEAVPSGLRTTLLTETTTATKSKWTFNIPSAVRMIEVELCGTNSDAVNDARVYLRPNDANSNMFSEWQGTSNGVAVISKESHGRVGVIGAAVSGRVYGQIRRPSGMEMFARFTSQYTVAGPVGYMVDFWANWRDTSTALTSMAIVCDVNNGNYGTPVALNSGAVIVVYGWT